MEEWIKGLLKSRHTKMEEDTYQQAKLVLLDTLGAMIAGNQEKASKKLLATYLPEGTTCMESLVNGVPIYGTEYSLPYYDAGLQNGQATVAIEMDEGNQYTKGHPAAHVVPVLLTALARKQETEGKDILNTLVIGYEMCARFGRAVSLRSDTHAHGTWGIAGATATAMLFEEDVTLEEMKKALLLSSSFVSPTQWKSALGGYLVRNLYAGHAIEYGLRIPKLLKAGFEAPHDSMEHTFGNIVGTGIDMNVFETKTNIWDIEQNYFKPYAYCRYVHAPIEAFQMAWEKRKLESKEGDKLIFPEKIKVKTYKRASSLSDQSPSNALAAKFSIPYAIAVVALYGVTDHKAFDKSILTDPDIKELSSRVEIEYAEDLEKVYPEKMPALVEIYNSGKELYSAQIDIATGGPGHEMAEQEIINKFLRLTENVYEVEIQGQIIDIILNLEYYLYSDLINSLTQVKPRG